MKWAHKGNFCLLKRPSIKIGVLVSIKKVKYKVRKTSINRRDFTKVMLEKGNVREGFIYNVRRT
jgi:hypothetical protein